MVRAWILAAGCVSCRTDSHYWWRSPWHADARGALQTHCALLLVRLARLQETTWCVASAALTEAPAGTVAGQRVRGVLAERCARCRAHVRQRVVDEGERESLCGQFNDLERRALQGM